MVRTRHFDLRTGNPDIFQLARDRIVDIEAELVVARQKKVALKQYVAAYKRLHRPEQLATIAHTYRSARRTGKNYTQAIRNAVQYILSCSAVPIPLKAILQLLTDTGIKVFGKHRANTLSAMLCNAKPRFDNSSGVGWALRGCSGIAHE